MFQDKKIMFIVGGVVLVLILGVVFMLLNRPAPKAAVDNTPVTLTWWKMGGNEEAYQEIIQDFNKIPGNAQVRINLVEKEFNQDYYRSLVADFARGIGPDMFSLRNDDLPAYQEFTSPIELFQGKLLTDYKNNFVDLAVRSTVDKDKVYGITSYVDNLQLYYNKNLLNQGRIFTPASDWNELTRQVNFLTKRSYDGSFITQTVALGTGGRTPDNRTANITLNQDILPMLIFQSGGQLYDFQNNKSVFGEEKNTQDLNSNLVTGQNLSLGTTNTNIGTTSTTNFNQDNPAFRAARFYYDFADPNTSRYSWNNKTEGKTEVDYFMEGRLAYTIQYRSFAETIKQRNNRLPFEVAELPQLDKQNKRTYGQFFMDSISRKLQKDRDEKVAGSVRKYRAAQEFLEFLSRKESQTKLANKTGLPSARREVAAEQCQGDQITCVFASGALYADNYYKPDVERVERIWADMYERVHYQSMPLSESLRKAILEYNTIVQAKPKTRA